MSAGISKDTTYDSVFVIHNLKMVLFNDTRDGAKEARKFCNENGIYINGRDQGWSIVHKANMYILGNHSIPGD